MPHIDASYAILLRQKLMIYLKGVPMELSTVGVSENINDGRRIR